MKRLIDNFRRFGVLVVVAVAAVSFPADAKASAPPAITISGGGTADFVDFPGLSSQFSVGAVIRTDGSVTGHFMCMITHFVTISGIVEDYELNADGSVTLSGTAFGVDHFSGEKPFFDCPFEVTLIQGGPGVGGFIYNDCVVTDDVEVVRKGHIMINVH